MAEPTLQNSASKTSGWVIFAGSLLAVAAVANLIYGLTLLINDEWIVLAPRATLTFDLTTIGAFYVFFAALQFFVAFGIFHGDLWARVLGIVGAALNLVAQFAFLSVYPQWSWIVVILDGLIIYALAVHGDEVADL